MNTKLFATILLGLLITFTNAFECPEDCACFEVTRHGNTYNHAKCTSLNGLRQTAKTNELHSLDASDLSLTKVTTHFDKLTNLTIVNLHNNHLSEVTSLKDKRIRTLDLSANEITSGKLLKLPTSVRHLNLAKNEITFLPLEFKKFTDLKTLDLADNPLNCSCETIQVRDWLTERNVAIDDVNCLTPTAYKGRSWLGVHLAEVCEQPHPTSNVIQDDNELLLGDDAVSKVVDNNSDEDGDDEELEKEFLPAGLRNARDVMADDKGSDDFEGSGDADNEESTTTHTLETTSEQAPVEEDIVRAEVAVETAAVIAASSNDTDLDTETTTEELDHRSTTERSALPVIFEEGTDEGEEETTETRERLTVPIKSASNEAGGENEPSSNEHSAEDNSSTDPTDTTGRIETITEPVILAGSGSEVPAETNIDEQTDMPEARMIPVKVPNTETEPIHSHNELNATGVSAPVKDDDRKVEEGSSTFILLGILAVLLIVLILYVATKRSKGTPKNRRNNEDVENPAQEMLTMDKNNLGKPTQPNNGTEIMPLIGSKAPLNKGNNLSTAQEPLLKRLAEEDEEDRSGSSSGGKDTPDTPNTPVADRSGSTAPQESPASQKQANNDQASPTASPTQNGVHSSPKENGDQNYQPTSPKSTSRYSPVYSHETGRVKIKLAETPKPKTPILVTRGKSNDGDNQFINQVN